MITLYHGDHTEASRIGFTQHIEAAKGKDVRRIDGKTVTAGDLTQALESSSLLGGDVCVAVESLFSKAGKKEKRVSDLAALLAVAPKESDIILWEEKLLTDATIKLLGKNIAVRVFKTPVIIFQFLDAIRPANTKALIVFVEQLLAQEAPELVWAMTVRRMRQLLAISCGAQLPGLQGWQVSRLTSQAKSFTMEKLRSMYSNLLAMEYALKTGASPFGFSELIKDFVLSL